MFEEVKREIENAKKIIIHRHKNPDGDALGAQIGLKHLIIDNYPEKAVYAVGDMTARYAFMEDSTPDELSDCEFSDALCIVLDSATEPLVSDERYRLAARKVKIDHHIFCEKYADVEVVDTSFESCCGLIAALSEECGWKLSPLAAESLYTGMITDSGRFRYDSTSAGTFRRAAYLMGADIDTGRIFANLYSDDLDYIRTRASFVMKIKLFSEHVAYIYTTKDEVDALGLGTFAVSRGMVNVMADIRGVDVWVNFTESESGVECELRSSKYNINPVAVKYGGGGHAKASGALVRDRDEAERMLADLRKITEEEQ